MPYALTDRQREVLAFIRNFISDNESSPRLDEIAANFGVTSPTAHKYLKTLQNKGYLYFDRSADSGFFVRLIERAGSAETVVEVAIAGKVNNFGEVLEFPESHGHFATLLQGVDREKLFALHVSEPVANTLIDAGDLIIFDQSKAPLPGDTCIVPIGNRLFLARIDSKTYDAEVQSLDMKQDYPIPVHLAPERRQFLNWYPLAYSDASHDEFMRVAEEQRMPIAALPPELVLATALRLSRRLAF